MTVIAIKGTSDCDLINCEKIWTLKCIDNTSSFLKRTHKVLLVMPHGNRTVIINKSENCIGVKFSLNRLATDVACTGHARGVQ